MQPIAQLAHRAIMIKAAIGSERLALEQYGHNLFQREFGKWAAKYQHDWGKYRRLASVRKIMRRLYVMAYEWGALQTLEALGFSGKLKSLIRKKSAEADVVFSLRDEEVIDAIDAHVEDVAAAVADTTTTVASQKVSDTLKEGGTLNEAREDIRNYLGESVAGWRSYLIVNTEFQAGIGRARYDMFERSGVNRHRWVTVGDDRVREIHLANEAEGWIPVGQRFSSGDLFPGDVTPYGCRCISEADLDDPDVVLQAWNGE